MKNLVTLMNTTGHPLVMIHQGRRIEFTAAGTEGATLPVTEATANVLLKHFGSDALRIVDDIQVNSFAMPSVQHDTVWLANLTGDPDLPKQMIYGYVKAGTDQGKPIMGPNPDKDAHTVAVACYAGGGQVSTKTIDGQWNAFTGRKKAFKIEPFQVKEFPAIIAREFENQQAMKQADQPQTVIRSHDIRGIFKPTMSWELDQMRYWFMLTSPYGADPERCGPTEQEIIDDSVDEDDAAKAVHDAKLALWKRCFCLFARPEVTLPTQKEFEAYVVKQQKAAQKKAAKQEKVAEQAASL